MKSKAQINAAFMKKAKTLYFSKGALCANCGKPTGHWKLAAVGVCTVHEYHKDKPDEQAFAE